MKKILFYLCSVLACLPQASWSQNENSDAIYQQLTKEYTFNPDGSMDFRYVKKIKLLTYRSFNSLYGESTVIYNPAWQVLKIKDVHTIMADGKKVPSPKNAFNEVLPGMAVNAPFYNNLREMVITHTGTERNAILNLDYEIHSKKGFYPALMGNEVLAEAEPVKALTVRIKISNNARIYYTILNSEQLPVITKEGESAVYTWNFKDIPAISTEEFQRANNENYPRLIFSTENDRTALYSGFLKQPAFSYTCDDEMKKAVQEIASSAKEKPDLLFKLQEKVINEFKLWPVPLRYTGFSCRAAAETWHSNGGTLIEKTVLLISLLKEAGITAGPVAVIRKAVFDEKIGSLLDIEDLIVKADLTETGPVFLSLNSMNPQDLNYSLPERIFVELDPAALKFIKTEGYTNKVSCKIDFMVDSKKQISGEISVRMVNGSNPWLQLMRDKGKEKTGFTGSTGATDLRDQTILSTDVKETSIRYSLQKDKPFRKDSNFYFFTLPVMTKGIENWGIRVLPKNRLTPVEIPSEVEETYEYSLNLPEGLTSFSPDKKLEINNAAGSFKYELKADKRKVSVTKNIKLKKRIIPVGEYADFKTLMDYWNNDKTREIIFIE
jgi:hypothetical protein